MFPYLEVKDDSPDESQGELGVPIHDIFAANIDQLDFFGGHPYMTLDGRGGGVRPNLILYLLKGP